VRRDKTVFECKIDKEDFDKISNESWAINWNKGSNCYYAKATHRYTGTDGKRHGKQY